MNLRMLAIASALFLLVPLGVFADPASDVLEVGGEVIAEVENLDLLRPGTKPHVVNHELVPEQVVEGHTTFVTLTAESEATPDTGNITLEGFVHCENHGNVTTSWYYVAGIPIPVVTRVDDVRVECRFGQRVVVTPTIYCTITGDPQCGGNAPPPPMRPTGRLIEFEAPLGQSAYAEELTFTTLDATDGEQTFRTYYAWATPVLHIWERDGKLKNFQLPIPQDRLDAMDETRFSVIFEERIVRE